MRTICYTSRAPAVRFAARELARHLKLATGEDISVSCAEQAKGADFVVGPAPSAGLALPTNVTPDDDWICVRPAPAGGYLITGSNPRSVLFAAYRYLRECGFRWIRPGSRGIVIPRLRSPVVPGITLAERPSYRFRTVCIEGATSVSHMRDLIDWQAKHGMNGYFLQFHYGLEFFQRWYEHRGSETWNGAPFTIEQAERAVAVLQRELKKRGMTFERMGHGWMCRALGVAGEGWDTTAAKVRGPRRNWLAQVNGKRELWDGIALNTNLNYGRPDVRAAITDDVVDYARRNPAVDLLHFWLADGSNNHCESPESVTARPSDFYVDMLNELDEKLTAAGLATRIVFLLYVDLLWPPQRRRIRNPDRFVLMFAPITRNYLQSYADIREPLPKLAPFVRNRLSFPSGAAENVAYLRAWQKSFPGPGFVFDYHAIWACFFDPNMMTLARTLHRDLQALDRLNLDGFNSCQNQRMSFPHNLLMDVTARTLWNRRTPFSRIVTESFADAYGPDGESVARFFTTASRLWQPFFDGVFHPVPDTARIARGLRNIGKLETLRRDMTGLVQTNLRRYRRRNQPAVLWSWRYLERYLALLELLLPAMALYLSASREAVAAFAAVKTFLCRNERMLHPALDVYMMNNVLSWRMNELTRHRDRICRQAADGSSM